MPSYRIGKLQFAFFIQHHYCQRGDRFGHRVNSENTVAFDILTAILVDVAILVKMDYFATPGNHADHPYQFAIIHVLVEDRRYAGQTFGGHAHRFRCAIGEVVCGNLRSQRENRRGQHHRGSQCFEIHEFTPFSLLCARTDDNSEPELM